MKCPKRKQVQRHQLSRIVFLLSGVFLCILYQLTTNARPYEPQVGYDSGEVMEEAAAEPQGSEEPLTSAHKLEPTDQTPPEINVLHHTDTTSDFKASTPTESPSSPTTNPIYVASEPPQEMPTPAPTPPDEAQDNEGTYPKDLFSIEDRRRGWVVLHITGMIYMFISLAIVCNEFFVPALEVITDKLAISGDVAGATVMAAGRSAPKLFTILIGVLFAHSTPYVGIGKIVGPAVFNILVVIGTCAFFARGVIHLTWWPLFRDVSFYILDLILLIIFFLDNVILWWESIMLVTSYILYVIFMKFNVQIEQAFKTQIHKHKNTVKGVTVELEKEDVPAGEDGSGGSEHAEGDERDCNKSREKKGEEEKKRNKPLSLQWPDTRRKQASYLFLLPVIFPLWLTVPDVRNQKYKKFFAVTFLGSVLWITVFSYLMVWWAHQVGETFGVRDPIMGLTILAAGTSIPDLITVAIVARKGLGDMAVSSSVGSNIFDITVGLPVPWLLYSSIHGLVPVCSDGLVCAIVLLFIVLLFVIISIMLCKWKMSKTLGFTMFLLYAMFVAISLMLHYRIILCPVSI